MAVAYPKMPVKMPGSTRDFQRLDPAMAAAVVGPPTLALEATRSSWFVVFVVVWLWLWVGIAQEARKCVAIRSDVHPSIHTEHQPKPPNSKTPTHKTPTYLEREPEDAAADAEEDAQVDQELEGGEQKEPWGGRQHLAELPLRAGHLWFIGWIGWFVLGLGVRGGGVRERERERASRTYVCTRSIHPSIVVGKNRTHGEEEVHEHHRDVPRRLRHAGERPREGRGGRHLILFFGGGWVALVWVLGGRSRGCTYYIHPPTIYTHMYTHARAYRQKRDDGQTGDGALEHRRADPRPQQAEAAGDGQGLQVPQRWGVGRAGAGRGWGLGGGAPGLALRGVW